MSQFGMQMQSGRKRAASPDVYSGLALIATVFLGTAAGVMWNAGSKVAPNGNPWELQNPKSIVLPAIAGNPGGSIGSGGAPAGRPGGGAGSPAGGGAPGGPKPKS